MTVPAGPRKVTYAATAGVTSYALADGSAAIPLLQADDLFVYAHAGPAFDPDAPGALLTRGVHYTLASDLASIAPLSGFPVAGYVTLWRTTGLAQTAAYTPNDGFPAKTHERQLDRLSLVDQEQGAALADLRGRALIVKAGQQLPAVDLAAFAAKLLAGDAIGASIVPVTPRDTGGVNTLATLADAAAGDAVVAHVPLGGAPALTLKGFLDRFGNWAEDRLGIQQANDLIVASGDRQSIGLPPRATIAFAIGVTIDGAFVSFDARGAKVSATAMTSGAAFTVTGSVDPPYTQNMNPLRLPAMLGPGPGSAVDAVLVHRAGTGGGHGPAHLVFDGLNVDNFRYGIIFRNRAYLNKVYDSMFGRCLYGAWQDEAEDGSENNRFIDCTFYNSTWAAKVTPANCDLHFDGCSFDALQRLFDVAAGTVWLNDPHVEVVAATSYAATPILLASAFARLFWRGGSRRVPPGTKTFDYWVDGSGTFVDECSDAIGDATATGAFAGANITLLRPGRIAGNETRDNCYMANIAKSRVVDPTFATLAANSVFVAPSGTGFTVTGRYTEIVTGGGTSSSLSVASNKLKHVKVGGGGSPAAFRLILPAEAQELMGGRIYYEKADASSGTMFVSLGWGWLDPIPAGFIPNLVKVVDYATASVSVPSAAVTSTPLNFSPASSHRAPPGANCLVLTVIRSGMSAGEILFSNPNFDRVG